jgi:hypothetical protein
VSEDELQEIANRADRHGGMGTAEPDIVRLVAEVRRLTAELDEAKERNRVMRAAWDRDAGDLATARAAAKEGAQIAYAAGKAADEARAEADEANGALAAMTGAVGALDASPCEGSNGTVYHYEVTVDSWEAFGAALGDPGAALTAYRAKVRREAIDECVAVVEAYRNGKPTAGAADDVARPPAQARHHEFLRGCASGERSALYSASCRLRALAAKGGE